MKTIRLSLAVPLSAAAVLTGGVIGCQRAYNTEYESLSGEPVVYDEAMALRDWQRTPAYYASGNVVAGPSGPNRQYRVGQANEEGFENRSRLATVLDPVFFLVNSAALIPSVIMDPPTEQREYEGRVLGPTYTAAVPLDAANVGASYEGQEAKKEVLRDRQAQRAQAARTPQRTAGGERQANPPREPVPIQRASTVPASTRRVYIPLQDLVPGTTRPGAVEQ